MNKIILTVLTLFLAGAAFCQNIEQQVVNRLMPYIIAEMQGTEAKKEIDAFYKTQAFKALGAAPYSIKYTKGDNIVMAQWLHRGGREMQFMHRFVVLQAQYLGIQPVDFLKNKEYMRRFAVCAAPIFVHETMHEKETADMLAMGFATTMNPRSEILGYGKQFLFMAEKQGKYPKNPENYYKDCDSMLDYVLNLGLQNDYKGFSAKLTQQLNAMRAFPMPPLDKENIRAFLTEIKYSFHNMSDGRIEQARAVQYKNALGANKERQPVFLTLDEFIIKGRWNWTRAPLNDLYSAAEGKHINFNRYNAWFDKELAKLAEDMKIRREVLLMQIALKQKTAE